MKIIVWILIITQVFIIIFLGLFILRKKYPKITPIKRVDIIRTPNKKLQYFYEPIPNRTIKEEIWAPSMATYLHNKDSLNEAKNYSNKKAKDVFRIITLGDSFTYGLFVNTKQNWTEVLESQLNKCHIKSNDYQYEVINLGVPGYDLQYSVSRYYKRGVKYNADMIIWFIKDDDFVHLNDQMLKYVRDYETQPDSQLINLTGATEIFQYKVEKGYKAWEYAINKVASNISDANKLSIQFDIIQQLIDNYSGNVVFMTLSSTKSKYLKPLKRYIAHKSNLYLFDRLDIYDNESLFFPSDGHPTIAGHLSIAAKLFNYLKFKRLIKC